MNLIEKREVPLKQKEECLLIQIRYHFLGSRFLVAGSIVTIAMAAMLVFTSVAATSAQHQLANIQTELSSTQTDTSNLRQEIGELTSSSRMNKIAKQEGLSLIESNIRTVD